MRCSINFPQTQNFDERRAVLFLLMSLSFVRSSDSDHDRLFAFSVLRQFVKERPEIIFRMHDVVFAELTRLFQDTNDMMLMATIDLVKSCFAHARVDSQALLSQPSEINERGLAYLHSIKFSEIFHVGSFSVRAVIASALRVVSYKPHAFLSCGVLCVRACACSNRSPSMTLTTARRPRRKC